jgi:hypothetical protein
MRHLIFFFLTFKFKQMFRPKFSWNEYFSGSPATTLSGQYNSRENPSGLSVYVSNCLFNTFTSESTGGALYCDSATSFLIEFSSFFSCKTSGNGGAIYFTNSGAQSVLYGLCGNDCCTTNSKSYQFAYIRVKDDASSKNCVNYSSIARCVNGISGSGDTMRLVYGKIYCPSINSSMNKCYYYSGIICRPFVDTSYATCSLLYSTFADNNALDHIPIYFNTNAKYEIKCFNILRNTHTHSSYGIISTWGNLLIEDSCILENNAKYIFYSSSSTITLLNCTVDKTTITSGSLTILKRASNSFIHGLHHISTQNCHSEYDSAGYLTAIPFISHTAKKLYCYTCKVNHCQGNMSAFLSIVWLFMFTFIHPNPSVYF